MWNRITITGLLLLLLGLSCADQEKNKPPKALAANINQYLTTTMARHKIPGLALAVIKDQKVIFKNFYGKASLAEGRLVDENTLFRVFSATKLITTVAVFQLIEKGQLQLEDPIAKHLNHLPEHWQHINIKQLLSHASGLPDLIRFKSDLSDAVLMKKLAGAPMQFKAGQQFAYNQTNYWLLAQLIEKITGKPFDDFVLKNQFNNPPSGVLFSSNAQETIPNRASRYYYQPKTKNFEKDTSNNGKRAYAGNGLNITLDQFIGWSKKLHNNQLLTQKTMDQMWAPFPFNNRTDQFLHGWNSYAVNQQPSYGFSGGNLAAFRIFKAQQTSIILLSNGYQIPAFDIIVNDVARMVLPSLNHQKPIQEAEVMHLVLQHKLPHAQQALQRLQKENPNTLLDNLKWNINSLGNSYTYDKQAQKALEIYKLNAKAHADWWVAQASLAEAYDAQKDTLNALQYYQSAIRLNTKNEFSYNQEMKTRVGELKNALLP